MSDYQSLFNLKTGTFDIITVDDLTVTNLTATNATITTDTVTTANITTANITTENVTTSNITTANITTSNTTTENVTNLNATNGVFDNITSETIIVDSTNTNAFTVRQNNVGNTIFNVDTTNSAVTINGDLTVTGNAVYANVSNFSTTDPLVEFGSNNAADLLDLGFFGSINNSTTPTYTGFFRDVSNSGRWTIFKDATVMPNNIVGTFTYDDMQLNDLYNVNSITSGNITVSGNVLPSVTNTSDLGSASKYFNNAYLNNAHINSLSFSGNLGLTGLSLNPSGVYAATGAFLDISGTQTSTSNYGMIIADTWSPGANSGNDYGLWVKPNVSLSAGRTAATTAGIMLAPDMSGNLGTVNEYMNVYSSNFTATGCTSAFGGYFLAPSGASLNTALYSANLVVGNSTVAAPSGGIYSNGSISCNAGISGTTGAFTGNLTTTANLSSGTTSPLAKLDVLAGSNTSGYQESAILRVSNNVGSSNYSRTLFGQASTNNMFIEVADQSNTKGTLCLQPYTGQVAIGTTSSTSGLPLYVVGGTAVTWGKVGARLTSGETESGIQLSNIASGGRIYDIYSTASASWLGGGRFVIADATANATRFTILSGGTIGINTNSPNADAILQIGGTRSNQYSYGFYLNTTFNPTTFSDQQAMLIQPTFAPSGAGSSPNFRGINLNMNYSGTATSTTVPTGMGILIGSGTSLPTNVTITDNYGLYVNTPSAGTRRTAIYADNLSVGYSSNAPPASGAIISGKLGVSTNTVDANALMQIGDTSSGSTSQLNISSGGSANLSIKTANSGSSTVWTTSAQSLILGTNGTARITIDSGLNWPSHLQHYFSRTTFTPDFSFSGGSTGITYSSRFGHYSRIGDMLFVQVYILLSSKGSSTGSARVGNFPFTINSSVSDCTSAVEFANFPPGITSVTFRFTSNQTFGNLAYGNAGNSDNVMDFNLNNNSMIKFSGTYFV